MSQGIALVRHLHDCDGRLLALAALVLAVAVPIAALPLPLAAAFVGAGGVALAVLVRPHWALYLLALSVPFESLRQVDVGGASVGSTEALVGLLGLSWGLRTAVFREREPVGGGLAPPIVLMVLAVAAGTLRATALAPALKELVRWLEILIVYLAATDLLRAPGRRALLLALLLGAGVLEAFIGYAQFALRLGPPSFRTGGFLRAYGTFGQPNPFAGYLGTVLPLGLALVVVGWFSRQARAGLAFRLALLALALLLGALLASMSRGGWLGFALAVAVVASLYDRRAFVVALVLGAAGAAVLVLGAFDLLPPQISGRLAQIVSYFGLFDARQVAATAANWAVVERMAVWQAAWSMFESYPFLGVGPGNYPIAYYEHAFLGGGSTGYPVLYPEFALPGWLESMGHAHNLYLNTLAENGAVGLAAFLVFWFAAIAAVWRAYRRLPPTATWWERAVPLGVLGVFAQVSLHNFFDNLMVHGLNVQLALLLALATRSAGGGRKVVPIDGIKVGK